MTPPIPFKESFMRDMQFLFPDQDDPEGVFQSEVGQYHLKHLLQVYFMGWVAGMKDIDEASILIERAFERTKFLCEDDWFPDSTWHWWKS